jgi:hypothetical protein
MPNVEVKIIKGSAYVLALRGIAKHSEMCHAYVPLKDTSLAVRQQVVCVPSSLNALVVPSPTPSPTDPVPRALSVVADASVLTRVSAHASVCQCVSVSVCQCASVVVASSCALRQLHNINHHVHAHIMHAHALARTRTCARAHMHAHVHIRTRTLKCVRTPPVCARARTYIRMFKDTQLLYSYILIYHTHR